MRARSLDFVGGFLHMGDGVLRYLGGGGHLTPLLPDMVDGAITYCTNLITRLLADVLLLLVKRDFKICKNNNNRDSP
jgi:hypothetical protein